MGAKPEAARRAACPAAPPPGVRPRRGRTGLRRTVTLRGPGRGRKAGEPTRRVGSPAPLRGAVGAREACAGASPHPPPPSPPPRNG